jgi:hypothetical protein
MVPCVSHAGVIDVHIEGVDDGVKTTKQRDYKEAVLFAKREAIERTGVKVKAITTVKDLVVNSDYIESKAEAVLLPGYNIMDIGYQQDGTYLVILVEKVKTGTETERKEVIRDGWFSGYDDGTVTDNRTGLMWAGKDNGGNIAWQDAKDYCENYRGGGYTDWRMPTQDELAGIYDSNTKNRHGYHVTKLIDISACCPWASETRGSEAVRFYFKLGFRYWDLQSLSNGSRALPVRSGK